MRFTSIPLASALLTLLLPCSESSVTLDEAFLEIVSTAARLSALAYETNFTAFSSGEGTWSHPDYDEFMVYTEEPDQALLVAVDGKCYVAFRGTNANLEDWEQNLNFAERQIHQDGNETLPACTVRAGFADFVFTSVALQAREDLLSCLEKNCADKEACLFITGHSQGGAASLVLSILTYSLTPTVVTFGMPPAAVPGCDIIPSDRFYRFVNSKKEVDEGDDIAFDPVPFSPAFISGSAHYGHFLLVGEDENNAVYLGFDQNYTLEPSFTDRTNEIEAHSMSGVPFSYESRINALLDTAKSSGMPVSTDGFADGTACEPEYSDICASRSCRNFVCTANSEGFCIKGSCEKDVDCAAGSCVWGACAPSDGEVEDGCPCGKSDSCASGQCDRSLSLELDWICGATNSASEATRASVLLSMIVLAFAIMVL